MHQSIRSLDKFLPIQSNKGKNVELNQKLYETDQWNKNSMIN